MSCPQLADSLNLDSWSVADFKVTTKSKQRYAPILASGKPAIFKLSPEPLLCPWGVGKFQDLDSGRIALDLILEDQDLINTLEKVDSWVRKQGESLKIKGTYKPLLADNEKFGNKKVKVKVQLGVAKFWTTEKKHTNSYPSSKIVQ